jgi:cell division protein FtsW
VGITTWFTFQSAVNIGSVIGLVPVAGVPLPFVSYGGSSLVATLIAMGFLLGVARRA